MRSNILAVRHDRGWFSYTNRCRSRFCDRCPVLAGTEGGRRDSSLMLMTKDRQRRSQSLRGWAISVLLEAGAIRECEEHGWMKDRADPHAREHAISISGQDLPPGLSVEDAITEVTDVLASIGDTTLARNAHQTTARQTSVAEASASSQPLLLPVSFRQSASAFPFGRSRPFEFSWLSSSRASRWHRLRRSSAKLP